MSHTPDEVEATHRCQALERELGLQPSARVSCHAGDIERRWRVECDLTFSVDGTPDNGVKATALVATGATKTEALSAFHHYCNDPAARGYYFERHIRGEKLEPYPLSDFELAERKRKREWAQKAKEQAEEGFRKHVHNQLAAYGVLDMAKAYHRKTGRMSKIFGKMWK